MNSQVALVGKNLPASAGGEGSGRPPQCSCLENPTDGGARRAAAHGAPGSRTRLSNLAAAAAASAGDMRDTGSIPGSGISPGGGHGNPPQYSGLENPMDREV